MPLVILPVTPSAIDLPKQVILLILTGLSALFWIWRMLLMDKIEIKKSFLFIPITAFLIAYTFSSIFSLSPYNSVWGSFQAEDVSLITLVIMVAYFYVVTNNLKKKAEIRKLIDIFIFAGFLAGIYAVLQLWGVHLISSARLESRLVNSIGEIYESAIFFGGLSLLVGGLSIFTRSRKRTIFYLACIVVFFAFMASTHVEYLNIVLIIAAGLMLTIAIAYKKLNVGRGSFMIPVLVFASSLFLGLLGKPLFDPDVISPNMLLNPSKSLEIASVAIKDDPFLGAGPDTFSYLFEKNRPVMTSFSTLTVYYPRGFILLILATTGVLTSLAYLFLLFVFSRFALANTLAILLGKNRRGDMLVAAVCIFWLYLTVTSFIYPVNLLLLFSWWLALAIIDINRPVRSVFSATLTDEKASSVPANKQPGDLDETQVFQADIKKISLVISVLFIAFIASLAALSYISVKRYVAAYYYQQAIDENAQDADLDSIAANIDKATRLDEKNDLYFRNRAIIYFARAKEKINLSTQQELSGEDSKEISDNINQALDSAKKAIQLNPNEFENYKNLAWLYQEMYTSNEGFKDKALENYQEALELSKNNPDVYYQLANLYFDFYNKEIQADQGQGGIEENTKAKEYLLSTKENLEKALAINAWHFGANILLVTVYENLGESEAALAKAKSNWEVFKPNSQAGFSLAVQYYKQGEYLKAENLLEIVLKNNPDYANARYLLGFVKAQQGDLDASLDNFEKVKLRNPDNELLDQIIDNLRNNRTDFLGTKNKNQEQELNFPEENPTEENAVNPEIEPAPGAESPAGTEEGAAAENPAETESPAVEETPAETTESQI